ncbi:MAG: chemotaxis protein CheD [Sphingomonadales bacterium]|nr:chemotaxis protein CheD [Sphingomonadales bacterium]
MSIMSPIAPTPIRLTVAQGDSIASGDPNLVFTTVLGSCVAVCLHDGRAGVGGMNHFLLAEPAPIANEDARLLNRYGVHSMELLINEMLKRGAMRRNLKARIYGGATMRQGLGEIGNNNIHFARRFLTNESIAILGENVGGALARRVEFRPAAGLSRCKSVSAQPVEKIVKASTLNGGDVELF